MIKIHSNVRVVLFCLLCAFSLAATGCSSMCGKSGGSCSAGGGTCSAKEGETCGDKEGCKKCCGGDMSKCPHHGKGGDPAECPHMKKMMGEEK